MLSGREFARTLRNEIAISRGKMIQYPINLGIIRNLGFKIRFNNEIYIDVLKIFTAFKTKHGTTTRILKA